MISKESSIAAGIRGVQSPGGKKNTKNVVNVSQPHEEMDEDLFEQLVVEAEMNDRNIKEVVRKKGNLFIHFDDDTEREIASYRDRETAWEHQRNYRKRKELEKGEEKKKKQKEKEHEKITKQLFGKKRRDIPSPEKPKKEALVRMFTKMLGEGTLRENVLEYVFENQPNQDVLEWDNFLKSLPKQTIIGDEKLKKIIGNLMKSEVKIINKSMSIVKDSLKKAGFNVSKSKVSASPTNGRIRGEFYVVMPEAKKTLPFGLRIENGRSLIFIPNETKQILNTMGTPESKAIRAELIHTQETLLDPMDDVVKATAKRDAYFDSLEKDMDKLVNDLSPVQIAIIKKLIKTKYKNI